MKAYLLRNRTPFPPFQKPASQTRFRQSTLESRLRAQLAEEGLEVVEREASDTASFEAESIVVQDDVMLSPGFLRRFLAALPSRKRSYQCEMESARFTLLSSKSSAPEFKKLPVYYYGDAPGHAAVEPLRMSPSCLYELEQGLPPRMHLLTDMRIYFLDFYGIQLSYWFDLQAASSLYCREFVANLLRPIKSLLPDWLMAKVMSWSWLMERFNRIGKRCRIHPTAILEGCIIGDNVEIGPFAYLRSCVVGDGTVIREKSALKMTYVGEGGFVMGSDIVNSYVGAETAIFSPMLYNVVFGERGFLSGGSGFADFVLGSGSIPASIDGKNVASNLSFLGSAVGDDCFIGANLIFAPGRTIPDGTKLLDNGLIKSVPTTPGGAYVLSGSHLLQVPDSFLGKSS